LVYRLTDSPKFLPRKKNAPCSGAERYYQNKIPEINDEKSVDLGRLGFLVARVLSAGTAEFAHFHLVLFPFAARNVVVLVFAIRAGQNDGDSLSHK
jgi:hypothetical protein